MEFELFDLDSGCEAAFLGTWGDGGLLRWAGGAWKYFPSGSVEWDAAHQAVYRNHRAMTLTLEELAQRGIPPPPAEKPQPGVAWGDNFKTALPLSEVPGPVLSRLPATVHLVLEEDEYESLLGEGKFLYVRAAFWDRTAAEAARQRWVAEDLGKRKATSTEFGTAYTAKTVSLSRDGDRLRMDPPGPYERYSIADLLRLLAGE